MDDSAAEAGVASAAGGSGSSGLLFISLYLTYLPKSGRLIQSAVGLAAESSHRMLAVSHGYHDVKGKPSLASFGSRPNV